jgi:hypothetical protein
MRRRLLLFSLPLWPLPLPVSAQGSFSVELIREIAMPRDQLFNRTSLWLAEHTTSSKEVVELRDREQGLIVGNASVDLKVGWGVTMPMKFKIRIDVKDDKYRMTFSQVQVYTGFGLKPIEQANRESLEPKAREQFESIAESLHAYLGAAAKDKSW